MKQPTKPLIDLNEIFDMQAELNSRVIKEYKDIHKSSTGRHHWSLQFSRAMQQELSEFIDCFPWKWWASYQQEDRQNARVEIVDMLHFLVSMAQVQGMTAEDLFDAFKKKMEINHQRQDSGYTEKDENDCKDV